MPWGPNPIRPDEFIDEVDESHKPKCTSKVSRAAYEVKQFVLCNHKVCAVTVLKLTWRNREWPTSFITLEHAPISVTGNDRVKYQIGTVLVVAWKLQGYDRITEVTLEVFARQSATPFWSKTLTWGAGACPERGSSTRDDQTQPAWQPAERAAYKARLTIAPGEYVRRPPARWTYFDVVPKMWVKIRVTGKDDNVAVKVFSAKVVAPDTLGGHRTGERPG
jgi:hypothetical protein